MTAALSDISFDFGSCFACFGLCGFLLGVLLGTIAVDSTNSRETLVEFWRLLI